MNKEHEGNKQGTRMADDRGQRTEGWWQRSEVRGRMSDVRY